MKVYLVGAGPGDPELITVKARRLLQSADCIFYDNLASHSLLDLAPPEAERVYVGKKKSLHAYSQEEICAMLVERGRRGGTVVRLKGGDPFIFGRGGEEAEALADAGIPFEVVPGVTSPLGLAAYAGIPLTHRDHTSVVTFVTGHNPDRIDWSKVGHAETLVVLMGLTTFPEIAKRLIAHGRAAETPAAAVRWGTRPDQETIVGTLASLPRLLEERGMKPPATIIVGEVVSLRTKLNWYEHLPLFGKKVVVTRAREQAGDLSDKLHALGADVLELPTIEIQPLEWMMPELGVYDWLIFTSVNGVKHFMERVPDVRVLRGKICAIGPATRAAIVAQKLAVDLMGDEYVAESLLAAFAGHPIAGKRILIARAAVARDVLPEGLRARGAAVDVLPVYRTVPPESLAGQTEVIGKADWITFTSSSTVENLMRVIPTLGTARVATIGPVTTATARRFGIEAAVEASPYTVEGLVRAIERMA